MGRERPAEHFPSTAERSGDVVLRDNSGWFPRRLIGKRLAQSLTGSAKLLVNHLAAEQLVNERSYELVLQAVLEPSRQYSDPKIEDSFEKAIFKTFREKGETPTHFLNKKKAAFFSLKQDGLDFMSSKEGRHLVGWLVIRQGRFNDDQKRALKNPHWR